MLSRHTVASETGDTLGFPFVTQRERAHGTPQTLWSLFTQVFELYYVIISFMQATQTVSLVCVCALNCKIMS